MSTFALAIKQQAYGTLADRLGNGLQNRVEQFDSARYLTRRQNFYEFCLFCFYTRNGSNNGSNNIVVFLTIQYYCLSLRHE